MSKITSKKKSAEQSGVGSIVENLERKNIAFEALFRLIERLGTTFDANQIVRLFLMTLMGQLRLKKTALYLVNQRKKRLEMYHSLGVKQQASMPPVDSDTVFRRWIKELDGPSHLDDFPKTSAGAVDEKEAAFAYLIGEGFSYVHALKDQDELLGVLFFSGKVTGDGFTEFDKELLQTLAKVATVTIKNALLYHATLQSKRDIEKFSTVKKEFINHTSHELRTPLTVLRSTLWSIESDDVSDGVMIDMAKDAVLRLQSKIEYLLSLNDIELNKTVFNMGLVEISSLLEDCLREVIPELEEKQIKVTVDDQARFRTIMADAPKIKIVLRSIIDNAVNFVDRGGNITITTAVSNEEPDEKGAVEIGKVPVTLGENLCSILAPEDDDERNQLESEYEAIGIRRMSDSSYLVVRIVDDGIGIPADEIMTLTEPFTVASNSTMRDVKGLGIGLSVSHKIITGHGGRLFCRSTEGEGAEFSIWLPLYE